MIDIEKLREEAKGWIAAHGVVFRSCWNRNPVHEYLKDVEYPFLCPWCGHWYCKGVDITEEDEERPSGVDGG